MIFSTSYFLHVAIQCRFTSLLLLWRFCFFRVLGSLAHHKYEQEHKESGDIDHAVWYDHFFAQSPAARRADSTSPLLNAPRKRHTQDQAVFPIGSTPTIS